MKRAEILSVRRRLGDFYAERGTRGRETLSFFVSLAIGASLIAIARQQFGWSWITILLVMLVGGAAGIAAFIVQHRRDERRLRSLAFEDWMDRVSAIARQYELMVMDPEQEKIWFRRFVGGLTPEQAVRQERDAAELTRYPGIGDE